MLPMELADASRKRGPLEKCCGRGRCSQSHVVALDEWLEFLRMLFAEQNVQAIRIAPGCRTTAWPMVRATCAAYHLRIEL